MVPGSREPRGLPVLQLSVEVARRSQSLLPTWALQELWGLRGGLEGPGLHGPLGPPWGHGRSFSAQSWGGGQQITLGPVPRGLALPSPPRWCTSLGWSAGEALPLQGGLWRGAGSAGPLRVPQGTGGRSQKILSFYKSQSLGP